MGTKFRDLIQRYSKARNSYRSVLNVLANYANDDGVAWPGVPTIASDTGMSERNVYRCLQRLIDERRISVLEDAANGGRGNTTHYQIWMPECGRPAPRKRDKTVTTSQINPDNFAAETLITLPANPDNFEAETMTDPRINPDKLVDAYKEYNQIEVGRKERSKPTSLPKRKKSKAEPPLNQEQQLAFKLMVDPDVGVIHRIANELARKLPVQDIFRTVDKWLPDTKKGEVGTGALVTRLQELVPTEVQTVKLSADFRSSELFHRHRLPAEMIASEADERRKPYTGGEFAPYILGGNYADSEDRP